MNNFQHRTEILVYDNLAISDKLTVLVLHTGVVFKPFFLLGLVEVESSPDCRAADHLGALANHLVHLAPADCRVS